MYLNSFVTFVLSNTQLQDAAKQVLFIMLQLLCAIKFEPTNSDPHRVFKVIKIFKE